MFVHNGEPFDIDTWHLIDGVNYPPEWFQDVDRRRGLDVIEAPDTAEIIAARQARETELARENAKAARADAVAAIQITVGGKVFDGDETSQTRMARAIIGLQAADVPTILWTLADGTTADVTSAELTEALILAGREQARLWVLP